LSNYYRKRNGQPENRDRPILGFAANSFFDIEKKKFNWVDLFGVTNKVGREFQILFLGKLKKKVRALPASHLELKYREQKLPIQIHH
jgi:hypothetical protein